MKTIQKLKARSVEHAAAIRGLSLSADGRRCADELIHGVGALIARAEREVAEFGLTEDEALDFFYIGLVGVYQRAGWGELDWRDRFAMSRTASWRDIASWRALKASAAIGLL